MDILLKSQELRDKLGVDYNSPIDVFALANTIEKLTIIKMPMGDNLSGLYLNASGLNFIGINSNMSLGRQRFSLGHELYHLFYDKNLTAICFRFNCNDNEIERIADMFAAFLLMPPASLMNKVKSFEEKDINIKQVIQLEQYYGVSHQAMLNQLVNLEIIPQNNANDMKKGVLKVAEELGYDTNLYHALPQDEQYKTNGYLIEQVFNAFGKNKISDSKFEEILLNVFRDDIVFGKDDEEEIDD